MDNITISPLEKSDFDELLVFTDVEIGKNYYTHKSIEQLWQCSQKDGLNCSFVARSDENEIIAARLSYAPGTWIQETTRGLSPLLWKVAPETVACFKSLFVDKRFQKRGLGSRLSKKAIEVFIKQGAKAILTHSALESPNNSSQKYLVGLGFIPLKEHEHLWGEIDYCCTHCLRRPCICTGMEMILYLN